MKYTGQIAAAVVAVTSLSSCVTMSPDGVKRFEFSKIAVSGERTQQGTAWLIKPNCTMDSMPNIRALEGPKHGKFVVVHEDLFPTSAAGDYRKCRTVKVLGAVGYYTSDKGYIGQDRMVARVSYANGRVEDTVLTIKVVK
ncbi:hypothetical protein [Rhizobium rhizogenes]|jgi:hypothetical protein|uniref:hypothetical protein n=1 Tax=Rhizobium rhizogenes TaxID=359 RepID=UPI000647FE2A|nr:hypothetical protein [Rhizobium rhizogenes]